MTAPSPAPSGDPVRSGGVFSGPTAIQTGDHSVQHNHFHPVPRPMPRQIGVLPRRADCYQYRAEIRVLEEALDGGGTAVLGQVVTGMGGVGKTQLAAHYARQAQAGGRLDLLVWITAATRTAVVDGYARAAVQLLDQDPGDPEAAAQAFLAWLEAPVTAALRWLVVLDDLADLADLRDLWPPESPSGRILVTTRRRDAALVGSGRRPVAVGLFTVDEAVEYLGAVLAVHGHRAPAEDLAQLAEDLGRLPLALSQAAAYLVDAGLDCRTYRRLLADRATALADALPEPSSLPDDQRTTVAAAWSMSLERADAMRPQGLARPVLQLAAMLDPNGIPGAVLTDDAAVARFGAQRGGPGDGGATAQEVVGSLRVLHRLSLIDHVPDHPHHTVRVHQLVQRSVREEVPARERDSLARAAADVLVAAWPEIERDTGLAAALRANTAALARHAAAALGAPVTHPLLFRAGRSLGESGQTGAAAAWFDRLAGDIADTLGPDHPEILTARHDRAFWQAESGDVQGAIDLLGEVLGERTRRLGADHIDTLTARHNLAWWRGRAATWTVPSRTSPR
ncbi:NB-ARC domain-containing protein [Kitasatospora arboriphila]